MADYFAQQTYNVSAETMNDIIQKYCGSLKSCNISVVAVSLDTMFNIKNKNDHTQFIDSKLESSEIQKQFFTNLFKMLLGDEHNYFKIAIVIKLYVGTNIHTGGSDESVALHDEIKNAGDNPLSVLKKYFEEKKYFSRVLQNNSVKEIINGSSDKITVVPQFIYEQYSGVGPIEDTIGYRFTNNLFERKIYQLSHEYAPTYSFLGDIFKISVHECMFVTLDNRSQNYNDTFFVLNKSDIKIDAKICRLMIYNFTNDNLGLYIGKHKNNVNAKQRKFDSYTFTCAVVSRTPEQLNFARCLGAHGIVVLIDGGEDKEKWEKGVLYCDKKKFLSNEPVAVNIVTIAVPI